MFKKFIYCTIRCNIK